MGDLLVTRAIPEEFVKGVRDGTLKVGGGAIRDLKGRIQGFLQFANSDATEKIQEQIAAINTQLLGVGGQLNVLQGLQTATLALQGVNLAVNVVGFAMVCRKLNVISAQLYAMDNKLVEIVENQMRMAWEHELERRAKMRAGLENLVSAFNSKDSAAAADAINRLVESATFYEMLLEKVAQDGRTAYKDPPLVQDAIANVVATRLSVAHARALQGHLDEGLAKIAYVRDWQEAKLRILEAPLKEESMWLGFPEFQKNKAEWQGLVRTQRAIPEGIAYAEAQYQFCKDHDITLEKLTSYTSEREPFAFLEAA